MKRYISFLAVALALVLSHTASAQKPVILYLKSAQQGKIFKQFQGADSATTGSNWATVKGAGFLSDSVTIVTYAKYYYPAYLNTSGNFVGGVLVDSFGTAPSSASIPISAAYPNDGSLLIGAAYNKQFNVATLTAGSGITITNGAGTITLAASGTSGGIATIAGGGTNSGTALVNSKLMVSSGGKIVEGTSSTAPSFTSETLSATTNQLALGASAHVLTVSSTAPAAASQTYTIPDVGGAATFSLLYAPQVISGDGAITIPVTRTQVVMLTKGSAAAITIAAPTAGTDDGKEIIVITATAQAHVITCSTDGFNAKGSSGTATYSVGIGNTVILVAYNGHWYSAVKTGVAIA